VFARARAAVPSSWALLGCTSSKYAFPLHMGAAQVARGGALYVESFCLLNFRVGLGLARGGRFDRWYAHGCGLNGIGWVTF